VFFLKKISGEGGGSGKISLLGDFVFSEIERKYEKFEIFIDFFHHFLK
jgi:hypothetical protein